MSEIWSTTSCVATALSRHHCGCAASSPRQCCGVAMVVPRRRRGVAAATPWRRCGGDATATPWRRQADFVANISCSQHFRAAVKDLNRVSANIVPRIPPPNGEAMMLELCWIVFGPFRIVLGLVSDRFGLFSNWFQSVSDRLGPVLDFFRIVFPILQISSGQGQGLTEPSVRRAVHSRPWPIEI